MKLTFADGLIDWVTVEATPDKDVIGSFISVYLTDEGTVGWLIDGLASAHQSGETGCEFDYDGYCLVLDGPQIVIESGYGQFPPTRVDYDELMAAFEDLRTWLHALPGGAVTEPL